MKNISKLLIALIALTAVSTNAAIRYTVTRIQNPAGAALTGYGLNNNGQVVGRTRNQEVFTWQDGVYTVLSPSGYLHYGDANDVNDYGIVVGADEQAATWWDVDGSANLLGGYGFATAINNNNQIVGHDNLGGNTYFWDLNTGTSKILNDLLPQFNYIGKPSDINNNGFAVGTTNSYYNTGGIATLWDTNINTVVSLESYVGSTFSLAHGINDLNQIVGGSSLYSSSPIRPFFLDVNTNEFVFFDSFYSCEGLVMCGRSGEAFDINESSAVVGTNQNRAFIWTKAEGILDLNDLVLVNDGFTEAVAINAKGQILVNRSYEAAYLLTPINEVPVPAAVWLMGSGLIGLASIARRKK